MASVQSIREIGVLNLHRVSASGYPREYVLVLTDGGEGGIILDPAQHVRLPAAIRLYDLRHTCATLLLCRNVHPKYVQELLGHASIAQTLDTYSHVLPGMNGGIGDAIDDALR
jgi:integrase